MNNLFINEQYDFDWADAWEEAFYASGISQQTDCAWTWDAL